MFVSVFMRFGFRGQSLSLVVSLPSIPACDSLPASRAPVSVWPDSAKSVVALDHDFLAVLKVQDHWSFAAERAG